MSGKRQNKKQWEEKCENKPKPLSSLLCHNYFLTCLLQLVLINGLTWTLRCVSSYPNSYVVVKTKREQQPQTLHNQFLVLKVLASANVVIKCTECFLTSQMTVCGLPAHPKCVGGQTQVLEHQSVSSLSLSRFPQSLGKGCTHQQETFQRRRWDDFPTIQVAQDSCIITLHISSLSAVHLFPPVNSWIASSSEYKGNSQEKAGV